MEQVPDSLSWQAVSELVNELGDKKWLGLRIQQERKLRGWSQARLSEEMTKAGQPLHQSSISKIEPPDEDRRGGRPRGAGSTRSVTIEEALGLSKVLSIPLGELLLPPDAVRDVSAWQGYMRAAELKNKAVHYGDEYVDIIDRIRPAFASSRPMAQRLLAHRSALMQKHESELRDLAERDNEPWSEELLEGSPKPPAVTVIDDILEDDEP
ncbi:MAG: helix-turn-helix transcriptional regulator [Phycicoccus sp.]|nr:helix-turn-helix transcriptional regulator [Phycicoccus sp.]